MATVTVTVTVGSKQLSGRRSMQADGPTADVTITFDDTKIKTKSDLIEACKVAAGRLGSDKLT